MAEQPTRTVDIPALQAQLEVPATAQVETREQGVQVELNPGRRTPRTLELVAVAAGRGERFELAVDRGVRVDLALGRTVLRSRIEHDDGGSGGPEATLTGRVALGGREVAVFCHAQDEDQPSLRWCLGLLQTLRARR